MLSPRATQQHCSFNQHGECMSKRPKSSARRQKPT
jgi:hypothetical protein